MPSFFSPFGLVPKPEMMRPRTGQRNCLPSVEGASATVSAGLIEAFCATGPSEASGATGIVGIAWVPAPGALAAYWLPVAAVSAGEASLIFGPDAGAGVASASAIAPSGSTY